MNDEAREEAGTAEAGRRRGNGGGVGDGGGAGEGEETAASFGEGGLIGWEAFFSGGVDGWRFSVSAVLNF